MGGDDYPNERWAVAKANHVGKPIRFLRSRLVGPGMGFVAIWTPVGLNMM